MRPVTLAGIPSAHPSETAAVLAQQQHAEVVVVKMGPEGAFIWTSNGTSQVPAYRTDRVWKIGSGDCFVAYFADAWMQHQGKPPGGGCRSRLPCHSLLLRHTRLPDGRTMLAKLNLVPVQLSTAYRQGTRRQVYLAGPFFDLCHRCGSCSKRAPIWRGMGLKVLSPYHEYRTLGSAEDVVAKDLEGLQTSDLVLAITNGLDAGTIFEIGYARALNKPVIVYSERHNDESLKMMKGSNCIICDDYTHSVVLNAVGGSEDLKTGLLLSGGMDSIAIAWWKRPQWAITFDYGQTAAEG